ncbi:MAG: hypothetical protein GY856_41340 [bacterium]|nr:hypothetical protein [bacterium]
MNKHLVAGMAFWLGAVHAGAQSDPACTDGVVKDDGSPEIGWGWVPSVVEGQYVQEFHSGEFPTRNLETVCVCWLRTRTDSDLDFAVVFYDDVGGEPAITPFAAIPATATGVGTGAAGGRFFTVDVSVVRVPLGTFYVGVRWDPSADQFFFICADTSPETEPVNVFFIDDRADAWTNVFDSGDPIFDLHRAILVRAVASDTAAVEIPALGPGGLWILGGLLSAAGLGLLAGRGARKRLRPARRSRHHRPMSEGENGLR